MPLAGVRQAHNLRHVDATTFATVIASWSNVFLAEAGASAALLGLLFVGVSINLNAIALAERADLRAKAEQAFSNLLYVLAISLVLLGPDSDATGNAVMLGAVGVVALLRTLRNLRTVRALGRLPANGGTLRRFGWTVAAAVLLLYVAARFWVAADGKATVFILVATLVLLLGAADTAWEMLVEVSRDSEASPAA
jgi:modulator of FtsH protease